MKHEDVRAWVLQAAPAALRRPPAEVLAHLEGCPACATDVEAVRAGVDTLAPSFEAARSRLDGAAAVRLARTGWRPVAPGRRPSPARSGRRWAPVAAAALAAGLLAVVVWGPEPARPPEGSPARGESGDRPSPPAVRVEAAGRVAVFATPDPKIHVVWMMADPTTSLETP
jgi:hypothetical protein